MLPHARPGQAKRLAVELERWARMEGDMQGQVSHGSSAKDLIEKLEDAGFVLQRNRGSHQIFLHPVTRRVVTVPLMGRGRRSPRVVKNLVVMVRRALREVGDNANDTN